MCRDIRLLLAFGFILSPDVSTDALSFMNLTDFKPFYQGFCLDFVRFSKEFNPYFVRFSKIWRLLRGINAGANSGCSPLWGQIV